MIVIGTRSALFAPLHNLGLIIVDEEHEPSYKQESAPRYQTQAVAAQISQLTGCRLVLASATPLVSTYFLAERGRLKLVSLASRPQNFAKLPHTELLKLERNTGLISPELRAAITQTLHEHRQVLLFLNLRGSARALLCTNCGQSVQCPNCEISLSFHADEARLRCHYCNYQQLPPTTCPSCQSDALSYIGSGTKRLETELAQDFPAARIARIDRDNNDLEHLVKTYQDFRDGQIDILAGTQMISRGLDIPGLHLVGIINANTSLSIADFTASERTFQLITQAAGRAGRREHPGEVIIQTYSPQNPAIAAASQHDYHRFYEHELAKRRQYLYPPFVYLVKLMYAHRSSQHGETQAEALKHSLAHRKDLVVLGPAPAFQKKSGGQYRWQVIVKAKQRGILTQLAMELPSGWIADLDPLNLL